ncbi:hypothetical protein EDD37DRAFT_23814 [Exophiala viscosa]|uniref:uncharacterized protein n=1 Tax=Exophiala viscosa TaxID=2486360 RepID=UPI00219A6DAB|nr:hypothetical protein EDD37DRAFT_23814 [Exophiala viscosa]
MKSVCGIDVNANQGSRCSATCDDTEERNHGAAALVPHGLPGHSTCRKARSLLHHRCHWSHLMATWIVMSCQSSPYHSSSRDVFTSSTDSLRAIQDTGQNGISDSGMGHLQEEVRPTALSNVCSSRQPSPSIHSPSSPCLNGRLHAAHCKAVGLNGAAAPKGCSPCVARDWVSLSGLLPMFVVETWFKESNDCFWTMQHIYRILMTVHWATYGIIGRWTGTWRHTDILPQSAV